MSRVAIPRAAVERLRELALAAERIELQSAATVHGIMLALNIHGTVTGFDDGDEPALLLADPVDAEPPPE